MENGVMIALAWTLRALLLLPGAILMLLTWGVNELDIWCWRVIEQHRRQRRQRQQAEDDRRRAELMAPEWPWT